jgi:hypothetical protein
MDFTPEHLVAALMLREADRRDGHEVEAVYLPEYDERVSYDELIGIAAAAVTMAVAAMLEAVDVSGAGAEVTLDEVVTRCSLRVMVAADGTPPDAV